MTGSRIIIKLMTVFWGFSSTFVIVEVVGVELVEQVGKPSTS